MINLYIVDYHGFSKGSGLNTYVSQLTSSFFNSKAIQLHYIWINSKTHKSFERTIENSIIHYHIPRDIALPFDKSEFDINAADYLAGEMADKENVIVHFNWINHCPFAYLLKQKVKCKAVLTKHCIPWRDLITTVPPLFFRLDQLLTDETQRLNITHPALYREQFSYRAMDHIICVTESGRQSLQKMLYYPPGKISVIYNGFDLSGLRVGGRQKTELRKKYGIAWDEKLLLFAGAITERKGAYDLAMAFDQLAIRHPNQKMRLVFAGAGDHNKLLADVTASWAKITITGSLKKEQLYDFYAMADIGIVPSYVEQCSYTAIEMMSIGLPTIVANVDGLKEIVSDGCGLTVKLNIGKNGSGIDIGDLKDQLLFFLENEPFARKCGELAKLHAQKLFTARQMAEKTTKVYQKIINENNSTESVVVITSATQPLVSILLPCFNAEAYLRNCLQSVLQQSWKNFELIIVDDASSDKSASIVKEYNDPRIVFVQNEKNEGIVHSLNKGLALSKGEYIARIDADDMMHETRIQKQVLYLEKNPDTVMAGSWHYIMDQSGKISGIKEYPTNDKEIKLLMYFFNPFSHPSVMIRADVLKSFGYTDEYKYCEDYELWLKIAAQYTIANIPECLTYYRVHKENIDHRYLKAQKQTMLELLSATLDESGIAHSVEELAIHAAICSNSPKQFFSSERRIEGLIVWVNGILKYFQKRNNFPASLSKKVSDYIIYDHCGIIPAEQKRKTSSLC